ncbi:hypothetical protein BU183_05630 [Enterococcus faecium]|nr:hypothetical protein BU183_05630 [Enterococcus faecium]
MIVFILSLFSSGHKLRISSLYQLLVGKRTTSVLIYGFTHELLFIHNSFPELKQDKFYQILQKIAQQGWIEINENEAKLTPAGADMLSEHQIEHTGLRFDRYGRTGETSWRLIKFAVQVISNLATGIQDYLPAETSPFYTFQLKKWLSESQLPREILIDTAYESLVQLFSEIPEEAADLKNVSRSDYGGASSDRIFQIAGAVRTWGLVAAALLLFVAMFLISNTIRITILSRQREIQIMRLVGAKNGYIRWPFFLEGGWIGLIGAILPILIITFGYAWFFQLINPSLLRSHYSLIHPQNIVWKINLLMVGIGVIIGSLGSIISMRRFLKF